MSGEFLEVVAYTGEGYKPLVDFGGWHNYVLSRDATVLLVENRDTAVENSDYLELNPQVREVIVKVSSEWIEDWRE